MTIEIREVTTRRQLKRFRPLPTYPLQRESELGALPIYFRVEHPLQGEEPGFRLQPGALLAGFTPRQGGWPGGGNHQRGASPALEPGLHALWLDRFCGRP